MLCKAIGVAVEISGYYHYDSIINALFLIDMKMHSTYLSMR